MTDLVRPDTDRDPDGVKDVISEISDELRRGAADKIALRECYYHLRLHSPEKARELRRVGWEASDKLGLAYQSSTDWWTTTGRQYFALLPGVIPPSEMPGGEWRYDDAGETRPDIPENPTRPSDEQIDAVLGALDLPGSKRDRARSSGPLRQMYKHIIEETSIKTADLAEFYTPSQHDQQSRGHYRNAGDWFRDIGRPVLQDLPGVDPPRVAGGWWRFTGVDEDDFPPVETEDIEDLVAAMDVGGAGEWADRRREMIGDLYSHLQEAETAEREALVSRVDPHEVGYSSAGAFWEDIAADALASLPGVESPEAETDANSDADAETETWRHTGNATAG